MTKRVLCLAGVFCFSMIGCGAEEGSFDNLAGGKAEAGGLDYSEDYTLIIQPTGIAEVAITMAPSEHDGTFIEVRERLGLRFSCQTTGPMKDFAFGALIGIVPLEQDHSMLRCHNPSPTTRITVWATAHGKIKPVDNYLEAL